MYHSIDIGSKNTWEDWHLIPSSRPVVNPPKPRYYMLEVPGADGQIDLTENLFGEITYDLREGSWEFYVDNDHEPWDIIYTKLQNYLHGRRFSIVLEDEMAYTYEGRISVNQWRSSPNWSMVTLDYKLDPYKYERNTAGDDWEWDPFDFVEGYIYDVYTQISGSRVIPIEVKAKPIIPAFYTPDEGFKVVYKQREYNIPVNTLTTIYDIYLTEGPNYITIIGNGNIQIKYKNGVL